MTANAMVGDREKALECGMNDHVPKPIDPNQLYTTIRRWFHPPKVVHPEADASEESAASPCPATDLPDTLDGVDVDSGLARVAGNSQLYFKILQKFRDGHIHDSEEISKALDAGDMDTAQRLAHTVKGIAGNLGANDLEAAAKQVDATLMAQDCDAARTSLPAMAAELVRIKRSIDAAWPLPVPGQSEGKEPVVEIKLSSINESLTNLEILLRDYDTEAQQVFDDLISSVAKSQFREAIEKIAVPLSNYDFDQALEELLEFRKSLN